MDLVEYCPDACNAMAAGAILEAGCSSDAGTVMPADAGSLKNDGGVCDCKSAREACEMDCPQARATSCLDCAANCGIDFARCLKTCL